MQLAASSSFVQLRPRDQTARDVGTRVIFALDGSGELNRLGRSKWNGAREVDLEKWPHSSSEQIQKPGRTLHAVSCASVDGGSRRGTNISATSCFFLVYM